MLRAVLQVIRSLCSLEARLERIQIGLGRIEERLQGLGGDPSRRPLEFRVFSQWGEDGILASLLSRVPIERELFVEFGVEDYSEANTRFLLQTRSWSGLVLDGSHAHIKRIRESDLYWRHALKAEQAFVTRENINELLVRNGVSGDIGLLSIDIDGNDYWVWRAIDAVSPRVVIVEYNSLFGPDRAVTVPYDARFVRRLKHHSDLYYGASIAALTRLAEAKGYALVAGNAAGNNAFFVRRDVLGDLVPCRPAEVYRRAGFRESRDARGRLTHLDFPACVGLIGDLPAWDVDQERELPIRALGLT